MNDFRKKTLAVMLTVILLVGSAAPVVGLTDCFSFSVAADSFFGTCGNQLTWSFDTETGALIITGEGEMNDYSSSLSASPGPSPWDSFSSSIKTVHIGSSVTSIGSYAFYKCANLVGVTIPDGVTNIGDCAFYGCTSLAKATITCGVTEIGYRVFYGCRSLTSVTIPDSVTSIGKEAFSGCRNLTSVTIPNSVTSIGNSAFSSCTSLQSVSIPDNVTSMGDSVFQYCTSLENVTIGNSVERIGTFAFYECTSLVSVTIPNNVTVIGDYAFEHCTELASISIPKSVTKIGSHAFSNCTSLISISIPDSVTSIGEFAFAYCARLTNITIPNSVTYIANRTFANCTELECVTIPDSVTGICLGMYNAFSSCTNLTSFKVDQNNRFFSSDESGVLYNKDKTVLYMYPLGNTRTDFTIPDVVTRISDYAFYNCALLSNIVFPDSVTSIGESAFGYCSALSNIIIPNSVTSIDSHAFSGCSGLASITIPSNVTEIGVWTFFNCTGLTSVTIPDSVTDIGYNAFFECPDDMVITGFTGSYAQKYAEEKNIHFSPINEQPCVTLHCLSKTDVPEITVYGMATPNKDVAVYDGDVLLGIMKADINERWNGKVTLESPVDPSTHTIRAVVTVGEEVAVDTAVVTYDTNTVILKEFKLTHNQNTVDLLNLRRVNLTVIHSLPFIYQVKLNRKVQSLKVISTKDSEKKSIAATYNPGTGYWTASDWFDPDDHSYVPGEIGLEIDGALHPVKTAEIQYLIDPSGYVYEAVKSNRVEGASAIVCYKDGEKAIPWNANSYEQDNPQTTDSMGVYHWDVIEGAWRVKVIKSGYEAAYSDWMTVPPEWTEVSIPLVTTQAPVVKSVEKDGNGYIITFSQYMRTSSVNSSNITISVDENPVGVTIVPVNSEVSGTDESVYYASTFKIEPWSTGSGKTNISVSGVRNYAGIAIKNQYNYVDDESVSAQEYTITWDIDGYNTTQKYKSGDSIATPADPVKEGYTFDGWSPDVPDTMPAKDITFTAVFKVNTYMVKWIDDGKETQSSVVFGQTITKPDDPVKEGYTFNGWSPDVPDTMPAKDMTFTALFEKNAELTTVVIQNYTSNKTVDYKTTITFSATVENAVNGAVVHWYIDGQDKGAYDTYTVTKAKKSFTVQVKYIKDGVTLAESEVEKVSVKTDFFSKLLAFFRMLFGALPKVVQRYLEVEIIEESLS